MILAFNLGVVPLWSSMAHAALGGSEAAVVAEARQLNASVKSIEHVGYRVQEIQLPSGTVLREFADATMPNLRQALGAYFDDYVNAPKDKHMGHSHLEIRQNDLVVQSSGHMRGGFHGRAYVPEAVPAGTSLDEIR
jgi:hypothetical protein